jgi:hypothetical protein
MKYKEKIKAANQCTNEAVNFIIHLIEEDPVRAALLMFEINTELSIKDKILREKMTEQTNFEVSIEDLWVAQCQLLERLEGIEKFKNRFN